MWNKGDRVLAQRGPGDFWYPGTVRHIKDDRFFVIFDDGEDGFFEPPHLMALKLEAGDRIFALSPTKREFAPARIVDTRADEVQVEFDAGGLSWTTTAKMRIQPQTWKNREPAVPTKRWAVGERVLAPWFDLFWYPGKILSIDGEHAGVLFDHGGHAGLALDQLHPVQVADGDRVQGRWKAGGEYFPGKVVRKNGEVVEIHYDDGDEETTLLSLVRFERDDWLPNLTENELGPGDRILGCWFDGYWYPGVILTIEGKRIHVLFDDNDQAYLTWDKVRALEISVGDRVFCRWKGGPYYFPGEVMRMQGERILVNYEDGREEWTSVRLVRLEGKAAE